MEESLYSMTTSALFRERRIGPVTRRVLHYLVVVTLCWFILVVSALVGTCISSILFEEQAIEETPPYRFPSTANEPPS